MSTAWAPIRAAVRAAATPAGPPPRTSMRLDMIAPLRLIGLVRYREISPARLATSGRKISYALPESRIERSTENCKVERDWRLTYLVACCSACSFDGRAHVGNALASCSSAVVGQPANLRRRTG